MDSDPRPIGASVAGKRAHSYPAEWTLHEELTTTNSHEWRSWGMKQMILGVCGMKEKTLAPPMQSILSRLRQHNYIKIVVFSDHIILHEPVCQWPVCDCLIAFFSKGFPLNKAVAYVNLHKPMLFNNLEMQYHLQSREKVYEILTQNDIDVPHYAVLKRPSEQDTGGDELKETDDTIEVNGQVFHKPFVEKPISAEDHNVHIYFPTDYGGGCQRLFRKTKNRSSSYTMQSSVRRDGSYVYEEFLQTDGVDVKVYTVGPDYAHAEARKCPCLDGIVKRDDEGIEMRYPVILTAKEKLIARKVNLAFKQVLCGFDLLRANGRSYVCDVNGFSFVKKSEKYYDDCAQILLEMITTSFAPEYFPSIPPSVEYLAKDVPVPIPKSDNSRFQLRCVIGIIRHGDRTPKQKMKMIVTHERFWALYAELNEPKKAQVKIKEPKLLQKVLNITQSLLNEPEAIEERVHKLQQLKTVLEKPGHFFGINRKVQLKVVNRRPAAPLEPLTQVLLLILKWGGKLTPVGKRQAEELGRAFRCMYPGGEGEYASLPGSGFLRLHSTYRHDLKVYASDEGRVQMTAAAFTKGLLDLEGSLASVRAHLVKRDQQATDLLDSHYGAEEAIQIAKKNLYQMMNSSDDFTEDSIDKLAPTRAESLLTAMRYIQNPRKACEHLYQQLRVLTDEIRERVSADPHMDVSFDETPDMMERRWTKLEKNFKLNDGQFDISKIPDIYDCIKYDLLHNRNVGLQNGQDLLKSAMHLANIVIPQEYGITKKEKLSIAMMMCMPLLRKIQSDLNHVFFDEHSDINHRFDSTHCKNMRPSSNQLIRTRLYFTSESHIHCMMNILKYGGMFVEDAETTYERWKNFSSPEMNFLSQIVFLLFEDKTEPAESPKRYYIDLHIGAGVKTRTSSFTTSMMQLSVGEDIPTFVKRLPVGPPPEVLNVLPSQRLRRIKSDSSLSSKTPPQFEDTQLVISGQNGTYSDDEKEEKRHKMCVTVQRKHVSFRWPQRERRLSVGYTKESQQILGKPGRELAAELSSTVQPLQHVASVLAEKMTAFLQQSLLVSHEE